MGDRAANNETKNRAGKRENGDPGGIARARKMAGAAKKERPARRGGREKEEL